MSCDVHRRSHRGCEGCYESLRVDYEVSEEKVDDLTAKVAKLEALIAGVDDYLEDVLQWYEGGPLPGEIRAKELMMQLRPWRTHPLWPKERQSNGQTKRKE